MAVLKDSGDRREFGTGAVRDIDTTKGRCDLLPLDVIGPLMEKVEYAQFCYHVGEFMQTGHDSELYRAIHSFNAIRNWTTSECLLEISYHYVDGAVKYGERNWEKGILLHSYIDSAVRHFLKYIAGENDEPHDRACVWNLLCAIWTMKHRPNMVDIPFDLIGSVTEVVDIGEYVTEDTRKTIFSEDEVY